ncbi:MAG TPA: succinylglutamate desuccinylase/aspartoacylase family protein [Woeseiaceae bacterium]|nr:succinylglutamate desuccinylase/aspartoacylase family protein [Woeseiaceae bacterium]
MITRSMHLLVIVLGTFVCSAAGAAEPAAWGAMEVAGNPVEPGTKGRFPVISERGFEASYLNMPVYVAHGANSGPTLCVTAAIHGDETNSVEIARRVFAETDATKLNGTLYMLPFVNADGFRNRKREMTDGRDLNRTFPGSANGSVASLVANFVFTDLTSRCTALIDLHTGSNLRSNYPQIRVDLDNEAAKELAVNFGVGMILGGGGPDGSLRGEIVKAGIPAIIYEAGGPLLFQEEEVARGAEGVRNVMHYLGMAEIPGYEPPHPKIYEKTRWVRVPRGQGGFFFPELAMGATVEEGTRMGYVVDPVTDEQHVITSKDAGQIIGMTLPQPVLSGYPLFHLGVE